MVVRMLWMHSWTVVTVSSCVLAIAALILLFCICCNKKNSLKCLHFTNKSCFNDLNQTTNKDRGLFRHLSSTSNLKAASFNLLKSNSFTSKILPNANQYTSVEIADKFDGLVLEFEDSMSNNNDPDREDDDVKSCISNDSKQTFYSTVHVARSLSAADTIRSASSHPELDKC